MLEGEERGVSYELVAYKFFLLVYRNILTLLVNNQDELNQGNARKYLIGNL